MKLPPAIIAIYGPESPIRVWAFILTFCLLACFARNTRRLGAISFFCVLAAWGISRWLSDAYYSFTPH